jgi:hypothetical protein
MGTGTGTLWIWDAGLTDTTQHALAIAIGTDLDARVFRTLEIPRVNDCLRDESMRADKLLVLS